MHRGVFTRGGGGIKRNWLLCCAGREGGTRLKRLRGVGTPGVTDEAELAKQHTISPRNPAFSHHADDRPSSNTIEPPQIAPGRSGSVAHCPCSS